MTELGVWMSIRVTQRYYNEDRLTDTEKKKNVGETITNHEH